MTTDLSIGSIWRKWDLQVQPIKAEWTPNLNSETINTKLEQSVSEYIRVAEEKNIEVLGITDHNSGKAIDFALANQNISIIPGVELDTPEGWHLLIFFSDAYKESLRLSKWFEVIEDFLGNYCEIQRPYFNSNNTAKKIGIATIELLKKIQQSNIGFAVFAHCYSNDGFFKKGDPTGRIEIIKAYSHGLVDFAFEIKEDKSQIEKIRDTIKGWFQTDIDIPIISSSDSHNSSTVGNSFTWIKADPTIEGLKQIVFDPNNRVRLQTNNPYTDYIKPYFSKIKVEKNFSLFDSDDTIEFDQNEIILNRDLVSIIGGRGTGKSILINYLAWGFKKYHDDDFQPSGQFLIDYNKTNNEKIEFNHSSKNDLNFIYIFQDELIKKSDKPKELYEEIKSTLGLEDLVFNETLTEKIQNVNNQIYSLEQWLAKTDENGNKINDENNLIEEVTRYNNLIETVTTKDNREKLEKYSKNLVLIKDFELKTNQLNSLLEEINEFEKYINSKFIAINTSIPKIDFFSQKWEINKIIKSNKIEIKSIIEENVKIKESFGDYKGDLSTLLYDVEKFQTSINFLSQRIIDIQNKEKSLSEYYKEKSTFSSLIMEEYKAQKNIIDLAWSQLLSGKSDWTIEQKKLIQKILNDRKIKIVGEIIFDKKTFMKYQNSLLMAEHLKEKMKRMH